MFTNRFKVGVSATSVLAAVLIAAWSIGVGYLGKKSDATIVWNDASDWPVVRNARLTATDVQLHLDPKKPQGILRATGIRIARTPDDVPTPTDAEFDEWLASESQDLEAWLVEKRQ